MPVISGDVYRANPAANIKIIVCLDYVMQFVCSICVHFVFILYLFVYLIHVYCFIQSVNSNPRYSCTNCVENTYILCLSWTDTLFLAILKISQWNFIDYKRDKLSIFFRKFHQILLAGSKVMNIQSGKNKIRTFHHVLVKTKAPIFPYRKMGRHSVCAVGPWGGKGWIPRSWARDEYSYI